MDDHKSQPETNSYFSIDWLTTTDRRKGFALLMWLCATAIIFAGLIGGMLLRTKLFPPPQEHTPVTSPAEPVNMPDLGSTTAKLDSKSDVLRDADTVSVHIAEPPTTPNTEPSSENINEPIGNQPEWMLHAYSFRSADRAQSQIQQLSQKGYSTFSREEKISDSNIWYRVYLGSYPSKEEANAAKESLTAELNLDWLNPVLK